MKRIGFWMPEKKRKKLHFDEFVALAKTKDIDVVQLDLLQNLEEQGPFELIIHKLTDVLTHANEGDNKAKQMINNLQEYLTNHPHVVLLDPIDYVKKLMDRNQSYRLIQDCINRNKDLSGRVAVPKFVEIKRASMSSTSAAEALRLANVSFPCVCKPSQAHGSVFSHQMAIIFNENGLNDVSSPFVAQTFINHNALLYKLFLVGDQHYIVERPSLKNFTISDQKTIFFDSHEVSKPNSSSFLNELDEEDLVRTPLGPETQVLERLAQVLRKDHGMALFGVDVIIENNSGIHYIIDINAFPGYDGVPEFPQALLRHVIKELDQMIQTNMEKTKENKESCNSKESSPVMSPTIELSDYELKEAAICGENGEIRTLKRSLSQSNEVNNTQSNQGDGVTMKNEAIQKRVAITQNKISS